MSERPKDAPPASVSLRKKPAAGAGGRSGPAPRPPSERPTVPIPRTIDLAVIFAFAEALFTVLRALALRGYTSELSQWLVSQNPAPGEKNHKSGYTLGSAKVAHDLDQLRSGALIQGLVIAAALIVLALALRRVRGASGARWALLIVIVLTSGPLAVVPVSGWPTLPKIAGVLMGVCSIAVIVLIVLPKSMGYFRACKAASRPAGAPARPGLAGLFAPRQPPQRGGAAPAGDAKPGTAARTAEAANPARSKAKAKVRADADAGASEPPPARSKAAKSRR